MNHRQPANSGRSIVRALLQTQVGEGDAKRPLADERLCDLFVLFDALDWCEGEAPRSMMKSWLCGRRGVSESQANRRLLALGDLGFVEPGGRPDTLRLRATPAVASAKMRCEPPAETIYPFEGSKAKEETKAKEESKGKVIECAPFKGSKGDFAPLEAVMVQLGALIDGDGIAGRLEKRTRLRDWIKNYFERHGDRSTHEAVCGRMADAVLDNGLPAKKVLAEAVDAIAAAAAKGRLGTAGALATRIFRRHGYPLARSPPRKSK